MEGESEHHPLVAETRSVLLHNINQMTKNNLQKGNSQAKMFKN